MDITFDRNLGFEKFFHRLKTEILNFQTVKDISKADSSIKHYGTCCAGAHFGFENVFQKMGFQKMGFQKGRVFKKFFVVS